MSNILSDKVIEQIIVIKNEGKFNMFSAVDVQREAHLKNFDELYFLIEYHRKEYATFILTGER